jgi:hypothetical protein
MKSTMFWDKTPCNPLNVNRRFGGKYRLHLQGKNSAEQETSVKADGKHLLSGWFLSQFLP